MLNPTYNEQERVEYLLEEAKELLAEDYQWLEDYRLHKELTNRERWSRIEHARTELGPALP